VNEFITQFHFLRPAWLLAVVIALPAGWMLWQRLRSGKAWQTVISEALLPHLLSGAGSGPTRWPLLALFAAWLAAAIALAGPAWHELPQPVERREDALVIVFDLSSSMYARDISPSRLVRTRQKLLDLLEQKTEGTTALVAYAGDAHVVSPLTDDFRTVANLLPALDPDIMPVKGSRPAPAVEMAVRLLRDSGLEHGQILLVTDGIREADSDDIARALGGAEYRLSLLGVGTVDGAPIPTDQGFLRDGNGNIVVPGLDREPLIELAHRFGGHYSDIQLGDEDIAQFLATDLWAAPETERMLNRTVDSWHDTGFWLVVLLIPVACGAFRRGWLLALVCLLPLPSPVQAQDWPDLFLNSDQRGARLLEEGEPEAAAEAFDDPAWSATANYRAGNYDKALEYYRSGDDAESWYNRGNALARSGKLPEAIEAYEEALQLQGDMEDADFNKALLEQLLEQQEQQQDQNSEQNEDEQEGEQNQQAGAEQQSQDEGDSQSGQQNSQQQAEAPEQGGDEQQQQADDRDQQDRQDAQQETEEQQSEPGKPGEENDGEQQQMAAQEREAEDVERDMANEQWLRRIPDDPSGLLRRKFRYESRMRANDKPQQRNPDDAPTW
jgi:Ca-activated chloride channel family protein